MHSIFQSFKPATATDKRILAIKNSRTDLHRLAKVTGWEILSSFAFEMERIDQHNDWRMSQGLWANKKFFWSEKRIACLQKALLSVPHFQTVEELEWQHECDEFDRLRKGE